MSDTPEILNPAATPDEVFDLILRVSRGESVPSRDICAALYQGMYAMQDRARESAVTRGRSEPPTVEEIAAHRKRGGSWIVAWARPVVLSRPCDVRRHAGDCVRRGIPARWVPISAGGVAVPWPVAKSRGPVRCECGRATGDGRG